MFRTQQNIFLYLPLNQGPFLNLKVDLVSEVGGLLGWGKSRASSEIIFERNEYFIGEIAKVRIICDNSKCSKNVKSFKFKLKRFYMGRERVSGGAQTKDDQTIASIKMAGCKAGEKIDRFFEIQLPVNDFKPFSSKYSPVREEENFLHLNFTPSVNAKLFQVCYALCCYVKHDAWNEFGEGKFVSQPIKIV